MITTEAEELEMADATRRIHEWLKSELRRKLAPPDAPKAPPPRDAHTVPRALPARRKR